jgi:hypothetical protein
MLCHECAMAGEERPAVALCKFCQVGLCKEHLVALYQRPATVPQYSCNHNPAGLPRRPIAAASEVRLPSLEESANGHKVTVRS